jgi:chromosome segregation ATPase
MKLFAFVLLVFCLPVNAESGGGGAAPAKDDLTRPVLSASGRERLQSNLRVLEAALVDLKENLGIAGKNLETIRNELRDLDKLEAEHLSIRQKHKSYLNHVEEEMRKNDEAQRDLAKWEKAAKNAPADTAAQQVIQEKLESARREKADRDRWRADATAKSSRAKELVIEVDRNLRDIRSRREPLKEQQRQWANRQAEYEKVVRETEAKKEQWEKTILR